MAVGGNGNARRGDRLRSWKEIASFFGTDERTVRRWEQRGLPVHRIPGGARATVYAELAEVEAWMQGRSGGGAATAEPPRPALVRLHRLPILLVLLLLLALAATAAFLLSPGSADADRQATSAHQPPQRALDLYLSATYEFERRTAASLERARDLYGRAIADDPAYAAPYAGLANTYLLLREFAAMPEQTAYVRARQAAERALALDPGLADAHAALAFVDFYAVQDWPRALRGFQRAVELDPGSARARHWQATALLHAGRFDEAVGAIGEAARRDPSSRSIRADRALILFHAGRADEAVSELLTMAANEREFASPHSYLAQIHLAQGRYEDYLCEARLAAGLRDDAEQLALLDRAEAGLRTGGPPAMVRALLREQLRLRHEGRGSHYALAGAYALVGDGEAALASLGAAQHAREPTIVAIRIDPMLRGLHGDPRFRAIAARLGSAQR